MIAHPAPTARTGMQAKDISDLAVLAFIADARANGFGVSSYETHYRTSARMLDACLPGTPRKVMLAKLGALIRRGFVEGCACGCIGNFELTAAGARALAGGIVPFTAAGGFLPPPTPNTHATPAAAPLRPDVLGSVGAEQGIGETPAPGQRETPQGGSIHLLQPTSPTKPDRWLELLDCFRVSEPITIACLCILWTGAILFGLALAADSTKHGTLGALLRTVFGLPHG